MVAKVQDIENTSRYRNRGDYWIVIGTVGAMLDFTGIDSQRTVDQNPIEAEQNLVRLWCAIAQRTAPPQFSQFRTRIFGVVLGVEISGEHDRRRFRIALHVVENLLQLRLLDVRAPAFEVRVIDDDGAPPPFQFGDDRDPPAEPSLK